MRPTDSAAVGPSERSQIPRAAIFAIGISVLGFVVVIAYQIALAYVHQSNPSDAELLVVFALLFAVPGLALLLLPSWLLTARIANCTTTRSRILLTLVALVPIAGGLVVGAILQWGDLDELLLYWIPLGPGFLATLSVALFARSQANTGDEVP